MECVYTSKKTKVIMFTKSQPWKVSIWLRNTELEQVHEFCYLGSLLTEDARCDKEIKKQWQRQLS